MCSVADTPEKMKSWCWTRHNKASIMVHVMTWLLVVCNRCLCKGTHFFTFLYFACFCMTIVRGMHYPCGCAIISHASCLLLHIFFEFFGHYSSAAYIQSIDSLKQYYALAWQILGCLPYIVDCWSSKICYCCDAFYFQVVAVQFCNWHKCDSFFL